VWTVDSSGTTIQSETNSSWPTWSFSSLTGILIGQPPDLDATRRLRDAAKPRAAIRSAGS
jgi:hypothetical protein